MSTRSIIAEPHGDGFRGRYCHSDGYPTWNGRVLHALVRREGVEKVRQVLLHDNVYWSSIDGEGTDSWMVEHDSTRFALVPGIGTSGPGQGVEQDEWITEVGDWGTEWTYILGDSSMFITCDGVNLDEVRYGDELPDEFWEALQEKQQLAAYDAAE